MKTRRQVRKDNWSAMTTVILVRIAENAGDAMTFWILTGGTKQLIAKSVTRDVADNPSKAKHKSRRKNQHIWYRNQRPKPKYSIQLFFVASCVFQKVFWL